jgi:hypothetical protein
MSSAPPTGIPGVTPRLVPWLPPVLEGATRVGPHSSARPGVLLRVVPGVGRFMASEGCRLEYCATPGADVEAVGALLEGGVLGALIHQRGELPLHASTLVAPERRWAVALAGTSGAGKSTTAYELVRRGWRLLSDDLTRITLEDGGPLAWPGRPKLRLLADACHAFGLDTAALAPAPSWPGKHVLELPGWAQPVALAAVVVLERGNGALRVEAVRGAGAARTLAEHTYRRHYVAALGQTQRHLELVAATTARTTVLRARGGGTIAEVASAVVAALAGPACSTAATVPSSAA